MGSRRSSGLGSGAFGWEFTFTSPSRLGQGKEEGFVSFFWVWSKKTKRPRLESSSSPLDPRDPVRLPPRQLSPWCSGEADSEVGAGRRKGGRMCEGSGAAALSKRGRREGGLKGLPSTQELTSLVDSPGKGAQGPGPQAWATREVGRPGDNVSPMVGAGPGICPERQLVGLNLQ